jgi:hypothetical protein
MVGHPSEHHNEFPRQRAIRLFMFDAVQHAKGDAAPIDRCGRTVRRAAPVDTQSRIGVPSIRVHSFNELNAMLTPHGISTAARNLS